MFCNILLFALRKLRGIRLKIQIDVRLFHRKTPIYLLTIPKNQ